jgi:hypothetical protein
MNSISALSRAAISASLLASLLCSAAGAQVSTGTIVGTISDNTGAVVSEANVTITNAGTGQKRTAKTNALGDYTVADLVPGHYTIRVSHAGFSTTTVPDFELLVAQRASVNAVLQVGQTSETVQVTSSAVPLLTVDSSSVGQVVDTKAVQSMPLNGRDAWQLTQLTPGAAYIPGGQNLPTGGTSIRASAVDVNVNGTSPVFIGWYLDGANITEMNLGGTLIQPSVDALQEFKVEGGDMSAEYGHTPTIINTTLKSGNNQFHGVVYEFLRNNVLDAKNYFYIPPVGTHLRDEPLHRNQYGGALGGPIRRNKTYFFVDIDNTLLSEGEDFNNVVPSMLERQGNFSQSSKIIKNPVTGQPYPGNVITNISSQAAYLLKYMPEPNFQSGPTYRAINTNSLTQNLLKGDLKIDEQLTNKDHIMGRYSIANNQETDPNPYPAMGSFPLESRGQDVVVNWTHIISPKWVNSLQTSYYRSLFTFTSSFQGQDIDSAAGILGFEDLAAPSQMGFPLISISNYSTFTGAATSQYPKQNRLRSPQYADTVSYATGKHDILMGVDLVHNTLMYDNGAQSSGIFTFNGNYSGDDFADFLLGYPLSGQRSYNRNLYGTIATFEGYFIQDNYRAKANLTINAGLRWEVDPFYWGDKGQISAYDQATNKVVIPSDFSMNAQPLTPTLYPIFQDRIELTGSLGLPRSVHPTAKHEIGPRFGFAWSPGKGDTVLRGAYGIFFATPDDNLIDNAVGVVPFLLAQTTDNTIGPAGPVDTLGNFFGDTPIATANPNPGSPCSFGVVANSCSTPALAPLALSLKQEYVSEWNLAAQHQFGSRVSLDISYVGNKTTHGELEHSINDPYPGPGSVQARRPAAQWGTITLGEFASNADYNALQAKLETQAWHGATLLASYAYGKCLDNGTYSGDTPSATSTLDWHGPCSYNLKQNLVASFVYQLPLGKGQPFLAKMPSWGNVVASGWQVTGIATSQSGLPFTPTISTDTANTGVGSQRPNLVGKPTILKRPACWFYISANPACSTSDPSGVSGFAVPAQYSYGDGGRNGMQSDNLIDFDLSMTKQFSVGADRSLEFRAEFFNLFNRPTFGLPSTNIDQSSGATVGSTLNASREVEFALKAHF